MASQRKNTNTISHLLRLAIITNNLYLYAMSHSKFLGKLFFIGSVGLQNPLMYISIILNPFCTVCQCPKKYHFPEEPRIQMIAQWIKTDKCWS